MTKLTPQQFLDSLNKSIKYLTLDHPFRLDLFVGRYHTKKPIFYKTERRKTTFGWYCKGREGGFLTRNEMDSIDWTGFDCSKPLERTR